MPVIATAGHVDHGKSTLVRALTGRDPDRWAEEQRRGLTIDLGFAWTDLGGGEVGFVDVPGHERFIKNMLAGVDGVDAALFVVAADEGWMPQSEEHLAVLDLIGVTRAVVALTRVDLVSPDDAELAALEVADRLEGTTLAGSEIVAVSAPAGIGMDRLRDALAGLLRTPVDRGRPRLWIDRSFTIGGAGTVVTGTLIGGSIAVGDTLVAFPAGAEVRVRGLQTHEHTVERIGPGNRAAANLGGIDRGDLERGAMLGLPGQWRTTTRLLADLRRVRSLDEPVSERGSFHAHVGSGAHPARISLLEGGDLRGRGAVLVTLDSPVVAATGDHVILREVGRRSVVAGGAVLDPHPSPRRKEVIGSLDRLRHAADPDARAAALLDVRGVASRSELAADSGGGDAAGSIAEGDTIVSAQAAAHLDEMAATAVEAHHAANPLRPGMPLPALASALGISAALAEAVIAASSRLVLEGPAVRSAQFSPRLGGVAASAWVTARGALAAAGFAAPRRGDLGLNDEVLHALIREGALVAVGDDLVYLPETLDAIVTAAGSLADGFTVAEFRDALGITRKHAVPLLEWMDRAGATRREGDGRVIRRRDATPPGGAPSR
ncbi:MAG: selenocysteine-specific translation elongation factor [Acidimicrobiia bacterium]|nr:selenocysteine-specific translation elongation factor [Acidimicrobiia bacterium]